MNTRLEDDDRIQPPSEDDPPTEQHIVLAAEDIGIELLDDTACQEPGPVETPSPPAAEASAAGEASESQQILQVLAATSQQMDLLLQEFQSKLKYDAHKERIIDNLHAELQEYKNDLVKKHLLSVMLDVIKIIDDIRKWIQHYRSQEPDQRDPLKLFKYLESIPSDLEDIFYWQGVKPFTCAAKEFDPVRQRAVKRIDTQDRDQDKLVAESVRCGYEWEGKVIRPEMVATYQYKENPLATDEVRGSDE
jgi:molecular chaperone GrpE (heat shock protein)